MAAPWVKRIANRFASCKGSLYFNFMDNNFNFMLPVWVQRFPNLRFIYMRFGNRGTHFWVAPAAELPLMVALAFIGVFFVCSHFSTISIVCILTSEMHRAIVYFARCNPEVYSEATGVLCGSLFLPQRPLSLLSTKIIFNRTKR